MYILYTIYDILTGKDLGILLSYQFSIDESYAEENNRGIGIMNGQTKSLKKYNTYINKKDSSSHYKGLLQIKKI